MRRKKEASDGLKTVKSVAKCLFLRQKLEQAEAELKKMFEERKFKEENVAIAKIKRNPKVFFSLAKKREKTFGGIGPFLKENGDPIEESAAEVLRKTYEKAFSKPNKDFKVDNPSVFFATTSHEIKMDSIHMTREDIKDSINLLSVDASPGPDGVPAIMMKKCRDSLVDPLLILWTKSMESGNIPEIFRTAYVTPILKPGSPKSVAASYRPVSLTSHIVKTFERVVKKYLQNHLEYNMKLNNAQHGFRERRSCLSQLLEH
jgi:hypothetical protein